MAGDEHYLLLCDHKKNILEKFCLGKLRYYQTPFSIENYKYQGYNESYQLEERMSDGRQNYSVLTLEIIKIISDSLLDEPLSDAEKEGYEDTKNAVEWINNILKQYKEKYFFSPILIPDSMHLVFYTEHDF